VTIVFFFGGWSVARPQDLTVPFLRGEVQTGAAPVERSTVELDDPRTHRKVASADVRMDGSFEFRDVPHGSYQLAFTDPRGAVIHETLVSVDGQSAPLIVRIPERPVDRPPAGRVSVTQLLHPPDRKARQATVAAQKRSAAGDYAGAAEDLERAVRISPDYAEAYTNLAAQHIRLRRYEQALGEIARATQLAGPTALALCNAAIAQLALGRESEAVESVRRSLELDPQYAPAHYLLGGLLGKDRRTLSEAVSHLELAAQKIPAARAALDRAKRAMDTEATPRR
jgi:tetratricopeptide (TPR) repeat protein